MSAASDNAIANETGQPRAAGSKATAKRRVGAPKGNRNGFRHGLRSAAMPPGFRYITDQLAEVRREIEDAVAATYGSVSLSRAFLVSATVQSVSHSLKCMHWLRRDFEKLGFDERMRASKEAADYMANAAKLIERLKLDESEEGEIKTSLSTILQQYNQPPATDATTPEPRSEQPTSAAGPMPADDAGSTDEPFAADG